MILGILHHGITVSNLDSAIDWYREVLDLELVHRQRQDNAYTPLLVGVPGAVLEIAQMKISSPVGQLSTHDIELIEYVRGGAPGNEVPVNQVGTARLAFSVADIDVLVERARAAGATFPHGPVQIIEGANAGGVLAATSGIRTETRSSSARPTRSGSQHSGGCWIVRHRAGPIQVP